ncbi:MAG: hypothetical protein K8L99_04565 [Anaerolineae bacterium]|nr:hypothetical protein [Anaerolineae bacterium]
MSPELLKAFFRAGIFVTGTSVFLLFVVEQDSPEYIVTILSICVGVILLGAVGGAIWYSNR